ncbi:AGE family epimerase/isomerase [Caulobacter vibrioides]|uniref:Mannose-6-phosphate isomerase n=2 Tax=Caulobacter vibrioides TaxID=155892 RepID=Q9A2E8_CAUVC|nr:AGE family epimerase/isomerase [Caulobacter vibrioides]YP_002519105.3 phosphomannose isomerase [Caulobacter vibrioides NA1000]AAK25579.1 mannose-6-phosphate isomerase [Caulobacter vibrioides CB15]ACL97197.3 phosphomannose isomerase [Caulobacter vibrioides NA1000]ATC26467.1 AGE family epimerase/isomerase [Caulobacter vibrioides]ATC30744.1 AGE family epimerase/isomerase [Caulobacter vibrioides]AZH14599.1 AGE family epimerase/isomerase [Caulobacter vibrioides]
MTNAFADAARLRDRLKTWAVEAAYPIWWEVGADRVKGGFFEKIDLDGQAVDGPRRGRVLPRQIYAYAIAGDLGWRGPWRAAVEHGLAYFLSAYRRSDGQFRTLVGPNGESLDDTADLYDQAFALFALAAVAKALPDRADDARTLALVVRERLIAERKHPVAGFHQTNPPSAPLQSNPHMHLFEAMLAWNEIDKDPIWRTLADEIAELALSRFIHAPSGQIREFFDLDWNPAPGVAGRICEPGHQFEWGWLLMRWGQLAGRADATAAALRMIDDAETHGVDLSRGVAINALLDDFSTHDDGARLWPQTERIKAAVLAAEITGQARYWDMAAAAAEGLMAYLRTAIPGLWRDKYQPDETFIEEPVPASSFYHIALAILEMDRVINAAS